MILIWNVDFRQFYNSDTDALLSIDLCLERFCMLHFQYFVLTKTTWWGWYLIEKKSPRIAECRFGYLRVCSSIIYSQQNPKTEPLWEKSQNLFSRGDFAS